MVASYSVAVDRMNSSRLFGFEACEVKYGLLTFLRLTPMPGGSFCRYASIVLPLSLEVVSAGKHDEPTAAEEPQFGSST